MTITKIVENPKYVQSKIQKLQAITNKDLFDTCFLDEEKFVFKILQLFSKKLSYTQIGKILKIDKTTISSYMFGKKFQKLIKKRY